MHPLFTLVDQFRTAAKLELIDRMYLDAYSLQVEFLPHTPLETKTALAAHILAHYHDIAFVSLSTKNSMLFIELKTGVYAEYLQALHNYDINQENETD